MANMAVKSNMIVMWIDKKSMNDELIDKINYERKFSWEGWINIQYDCRYQSSKDKQVYLLL